MPTPPDLVTTAEVGGALSLTSAQTTELPSVITQASRAIERFCDRILAGPVLCDEVIEPGRTRTLRLKQRPVSDITRVVSSPWGVMNVSNIDTTNSDASVKLTVTGDAPYTQSALTGLSLFSLKAGVATTTPLSFTTYSTLGQLAAAINLIPGWQATVAGSGSSTSYDNFPCSYLSLELGSRAALGVQVPLWAFITAVTDYNADFQRGILTIGGGWPFTGLPLLGWVPDTFRFPDRTWGANKRFGQVRCIYSAGYTTIPDDLKRACIQVVQAFFASEELNGLVRMERAGTDAYELAPMSDDLVRVAAGGMLRQYRRFAC